MKLKFKKIDENAVVPQYQHKGEDACFDVSILIDSGRNNPFHYTKFGDKLYYLFDDLNNANKVVIPPHYSYVFNTGLKAEIETGYVMKLYVRSSTGIKSGLMLSNGTGIIDSNYRGEIMVALTNTTNEPVTVENLSRVCQAEISKVIDVDIEVVDELSETTRGEGGIGSTGNK